MAQSTHSREAGDAVEEAEIEEGGEVVGPFVSLAREAIHTQRHVVLQDYRFRPPSLGYIGLNKSFYKLISADVVHILREAGYDLKGKKVQMRDTLIKATRDYTVIVTEPGSYYMVTEFGKKSREPREVH
jgi:hypothetical protein